MNGDQILLEAPRDIVPVSNSAENVYLLDNNWEWKWIRTREKTEGVSFIASRL